MPADGAAEASPSRVKVSENRCLASDLAEAATKSFGVCFPYRAPWLLRRAGCCAVGEFFSQRAGGAPHISYLQPLKSPFDIAITKM